MKQCPSCMPVQDSFEMLPLFSSTQCTCVPPPGKGAWVCAQRLIKLQHAQTTVCWTSVGSKMHLPTRVHILSVVSRKGEHGSQQKPKGGALGSTTSGTWAVPTHLSPASRDTGHRHSYSLSLPNGNTVWVPCGTRAHNSPKRLPNDSRATVNAKHEDKLTTAKHEGGHRTIEKAQTMTSPSLQLHFASSPPVSSPCEQFCLPPCGTSLMI